MGESTEQCVICLRSFGFDDVVGHLDGAPAHLTCLERIRKPGAKMDDRPAAGGFRNARSDDGEPICPVCGQPIALGQGAAPSREFMLHIVCWDRGGRAGT